MIWMLTATASMFTEPTPEPLEPRVRTWGGDEPCDATAEMLAIGAAPADDPSGTNDPGALLAHDLRVLEAWERIRTCRTVDREPSSTFQMFGFAQVLVAAARKVAKRDPVLAAERAVEAYAAGNDVSTGPLVASMVGTAVHLQALEVLGEVWEDLPEEDRTRLAAELARVHRLRPGLDLEAETRAVERVAATMWFDGTCRDAHGAALDRARTAMAEDPERLRAPRSPSLADRLTGCGDGVERAVASWLEDEATLEDEVRALVDQGMQ